jgi:hypothetical protein
MEDLLVFLFNSFDKKENLSNLKESLNNLNVEYIQVSAYNEVNEYKKDKWFLLLRKDEYLQDLLANSIPIYISNPDRYKAFAFFKTEDIDKFSLCPRLFHPSVVIDNNWHPVNIDKHCVINALDGWIYKGA